MKNDNCFDKIRFEKIKKKYYEDILTLYNYYIIATLVLYETDPLNIRQLIKKLQLKNKKTKGYTIFYNNIFCGFCLLKPFYPEETNLNIFQITMYLKQEYTGMGIGTIALKYLENIAQNSAIISLIASISSENHSSIKFFEKNGYIKCGHFKNMGFKFNRYIDNVYYQKLLF